MNRKLIDIFFVYDVLVLQVWMETKWIASLWWWLWWKRYYFQIDSADNIQKFLHLTSSIAGAEQFVDISKSCDQRIFIIFDVGTHFVWFFRFWFLYDCKYHGTFLLNFHFSIIWSAFYSIHVWNLKPGNRREKNPTANKTKCT